MSGRTVVKKVYVDWETGFFNFEIEYRGHRISITPPDSGTYDEWGPPPSGIDLDALIESGPTTQTLEHTTIEFDGDPFDGSGDFEELRTTRALGISVSLISDT